MVEAMLYRSSIRNVPRDCVNVVDTIQLGRGIRLRVE